ncbi:MAG: tRNA (adenosine(37)-N6)-threonylcarbamoyltransferase complex dimerization subunit type 1 TsaB [Armatimonadota bacterium]
MLILALETSGDRCSVAVARGKAVLAQIVFDHERRLVERLPEMVAAACARAGCGIDDIDAIAAGIGPGSFTGARVAATFAKAWAWATGKPAVGVPGFPAAAACEPTGRTVVGIAPCRRGEAIVWVGGDDYRVLPIDRIVGAVRELHGDHPVIAIGEAAAWLPATEGIELRPHPPLASAIAAAAWEVLRTGDRPDPNTLGPLYVAPPPIRQGVSP